jgi:hypothetical protein
MDVHERGEGGVNWIDLAQDRAKSWAFVNTVLNLRLQRISSLVELIAFQEGLCSMELARNLSLRNVVD